MNKNFRTLFGSTALALTGAAHFVTLPSAALAATAQSSPWLGTGADLLIVGDPVGATKSIAGIGIRVRKSLGGSTALSAPIKSAKEGSFHMSGLEPGDYEVMADGRKIKMFKVGSDGRLSGVVTTDSVMQTRPSSLRLRPCPNRENDPCDYISIAFSAESGTEKHNGGLKGTCATGRDKRGNCLDKK